MTDHLGLTLMCFLLSFFLLSSLKFMKLGTVSITINSENLINSFKLLPPSEVATNV